MSRVKTLALATVVLFALAGCAQLFEFNLFAGMDNPPTPSASDYTGSDGLDQPGEDLNSPSVVDALTEDPALVQTIEDDIWDTYLDDPLSSEEDQEAAILYADLALKTSEGEELVNNIVDAMVSGTLGGSTVAEILADIIPPEALADEATFTTMVNALLTAYEAYLLLGASVDAIPVDGVADGTLPPDALPGDIAQKALVAFTMRATVDAIMTAPPPPDISESDAIAELYLIATDDPAADPALASIAPDLSSPDNAILALLDLAGLPVP